LALTSWHFDASLRSFSAFEFILPGPFLSGTLKEIVVVVAVSCEIKSQVQQSIIGVEKTSWRSLL